MPSVVDLTSDVTATADCPLHGVIWDSSRLLFTGRNGDSRLSSDEVGDDEESAYVGKVSDVSEDVIRLGYWASMSMNRDILYDCDR